MAKKTTLMLDESLYGDVRKYAAARGTSVSSVVAEALGVYFAQSVGQSKPRLKLTTASGGGWMGPLDPRSNRELLDAIDEDSDLPGK